MTLGVYPDLTGDVVVVTGGVGKLGVTWCDAAAQAGATVVALDLDAARPDEGFASISERHGSRIGRVAADVTSRESLEEALQKIKADVGIPNVLVNNAGVDQPPQATVSYRLTDVPAEAVTRIFDVNVLGAFLAMQVFGGAMIERGGGSIVNIGSLYAAVSPDERFYDHIETDPPFLKPPAYGASKAALVNMTRYFATHWARYGVRVNVLSPGGVAGGQDPQFTEKFRARVPLARLAEARDLAGPLVFLASEASSYVTGVELPVDGGYRAW